MLPRVVPAVSVACATPREPMPNSQAASPLHRRLIPFWPWLIVLLPLTVYAVSVPHFGGLQNNDYFGSIIRYLGDDEGGPWERAKRYTKARSNEHRIAVPMLVYHANWLLSRGSNRPLSVLTVGMMAFVFVVLFWLLPATVRGPPLHLIFFGLVLSAFVFTPVAAHNVAMGFSGTMWFLANVAFVSALAVLVRRGPTGSPRGGMVALWPLVFLGAAGLFSYSTSLAMWPALVIAALCLRLGWRKLVLLITLAGASYGYYFATYAVPKTTPGPNTSDPLAALGFFGIYLGGLFTRDARPAAWIGLAGALAAAVVVAYVLIKRRDRLPMLAPWLALQTYGVVNAAGTAIGRSNFGERMGVSSRYATLPGFFWAGLLISIGLLVVDAKMPEAKRRDALVALFGVFLTFALPMNVRGVSLLVAFANRAQHQQLGELAVVRGHYDYDVLRNITPAVDQLWAARDTLIRLGHHPFHRPHPLPSQGALTPRADQPHAALRGQITDRSPITEEAVVRPLGWVTSTAAPVVALAVTDGEGRPVGELVLGMTTPLAARRAGVHSRGAGWGGYAVGIDAEQLQVYAKLADDPSWYPLPNE